MKKTLIFLYILIISAAYSSAVAPPTSLLIEGKNSTEAENDPSSNHAGIDTPTPQFSWTADPSTTQVACQVIVADNPSDIITETGSTWDSGKIYTSNEFINYPSTAATLQSLKKYYWAVRTWDVAGDSSSYTSSETFYMNHFIKQQQININFNKGNMAFAVGDITGDGLNDFVEAEYDSNYVTAYVNTGTGTFSYHWRSPKENYSQALALADINNDGDLDLIVLNYSVDYPDNINDTNTRIYLNDGTGNFTKTEVSSENGSSTIAVGDIDRDGDLDFIDGQYDDYNDYYRNNGNGTFSIYSAGIVNGKDAKTYDMLLADFNGDSYLDLITGNSQEQNYIYLNDGNGKLVYYGTAGSETENTLTLTLADINNDGHWDFIAGNGLGSSADRYYQNDGNGNFTSVGTTIKTDDSRTLSSGDIDNDGDIDYVEGNSNSYNRVYTNNGSSFELKYISADIPITYKLNLNDFTGDGAMDILRGIYNKTTDYFLISYSTISNNGPTPPSSDFSSYFSTSTKKYKIQWGNGTDDHTPQNQLAYNIRLGTAAGCYNIISGAIGTTDNSGSFWGNIGRSTFVYLSLAPKTYFWQIQAIDTSKTPGTWSEEQIINIAPFGGWDSDNVLLSTCAVQWGTSQILDPNPPYDIIEDRRGLMDISFKVKDQELNKCKLTSFAYSTSTAANNWIPLQDDSSYLTLTPYNVPQKGLWPDNNSNNFTPVFSTSPYSSATAYKFIWKTDLLPELQNIQCDDTRIRFKVYDIYNATSTSYVVSSTFSIDNLDPAQPGELTAGPYNNTEHTIYFGTPSSDSNFSDYKIYVHADNSNVDQDEDYHDFEWDNSDDTNMSYAAFNGKSSTTITGLESDTTYYLKIYAYDIYSNYSSTGILKIKTNDPPELQSGVPQITAVQRTDGTDLVDITFSGIDNDVEYSSYVFSQCFYRMGGTDYIMTPSTADASFDNEPLLFNKSVTNYNFVWNAGYDVPYISSPTYFYITVTDGRNTGSTGYSISYAIDTKPPYSEGVSGTGATSTSINWLWSQASEDHFLKYELWYSSVSADPVVNKDTATANYITISNQAVTSTTTYNNLPFTEYYACLWLYDTYGHDNRTSTASYRTGFPPEANILQQPVPATNGSGNINIKVNISDKDKDTCRLKIEYSRIDSPYDWHLVNAIDLLDYTYGTVTENYPSDFQIRQIATEYNTQTITNTITFNWNSKADIDDIYDDEVFLRFTVNDGMIDDYTPDITDSFKIDNSQPKYNSDQWSMSQYNQNGSSFTLRFKAEDGADLNVNLNAAASDLTLFRVYKEQVSSEYIDLTGSSVTASVNYLYLKLNDEKSNQIARWDGENKTPYLLLLSSATRDDYGNYSLPTSTTSPILFGSAIDWKKDTSCPQVISATYTISGGDVNLYIQFDEYMDILALTDSTISGIVIQDSSKTLSNFQTLDSSCTFSYSPADAKMLAINIPYGKHDFIWNWSSEHLYLSISSTTICDLSGNALTPIPSNNAKYIYTQISTDTPKIINVSPLPKSYNIPLDSIITVQFDDFLKPEAVNGITVKRIKSSTGESVNSPISGTTNYNKEFSILTFSPDNLPGNSVIEVIITKDFIRNFAGMMLENNYSWNFKTTLTCNDNNILVSPSGNITINVPKNQLPANGRVEFTECIPPNAPTEASAASMSQATFAENTWANPYHYQFGDLTAEIVFYSTSGVFIPSLFTENAELSFNYNNCLLDDGSAYLKYQTNPPVKETTLKIYYLNEDINKWIPLNTSVDTEEKKVSASIRHFSVYAVMGAENYDIEEAHPYPVPYKPTEIPPDFNNTLRAGITFTMLPSECDIEIFTISGRLVNTMHHSDNSLQINGQVGNYYWYPIQNSYGEDVASGVYIYYITGGNNYKMGKLMIIR